MLPSGQLPDARKYAAGGPQSTQSSNSACAFMSVKVSRDLEKTSTRAKVAKAKRLDNNTTAMAAAAANTDSALGATANAADFSSAETNGKGGGGGAAVISTDSGGGASGAAGTTLGFGEAAAKIGGDTVTAAVATAAASGRKSGRGKGDRGKRKDGHESSGSSGTGVDSSEGALVEIPKNATGTAQEQSDVQSPADKGAHDAAEVAAGQLEQVIKDLNSKITAAGAATTAAATTAASASVTTSGKNNASTTVTSSSDGALVNLSDGGNVEAKEGTEAASTAAAMLTVNSTAGLGAGLNVSGIAAVLQEAVAATKVKQEEALQEIQHSLTSTNVKVAERVVGIAKDLSVQKNEASLGKGTAACVKWRTRHRVFRGHSHMARAVSIFQTKRRHGRWMYRDPHRLNRRWNLLPWFLPLR